MKTLVKNIRRFGIVLVALLLLVNISVFTFTASAQTATETDFMTILNTHRVSLGENPLEINSSLSNAAYLHSKDMAENGYFSHTSADGRTFVQRIVATGYTNWASLAENIAYSYGPTEAASIYEMWKNSPGHYANMIGNFAEAGLGVYTLNNYTYCTLDLGTSRIPPVPTPAPNFSFSASPATLNITAGESSGTTVSATSMNSFTGSVALTITTLPAGWTAVFAPTSLALVSGGSGSSLLSITAPSGAQAGTYNFTVNGTNGSISHSTTVTVNIKGIKTAVSAPPNLTATAGNAQITLTWSAPVNNGVSTVSGYRLYCRTATTSPKLLVTTGKVLSYKDSTTANRTTYYYTVTALNSAGESAKSNEVYATPAAPVAKVLNMTTATNNPTYSRGSKVILTLTVTDNSTLKPVTGTRVMVKIYSPNGLTARTITTTTGTSGKAQVSFNLRSTDKLGTYTIKTSTAKAGYQINTGQVTFTVK